MTVDEGHDERAPVEAPARARPSTLRAAVVTAAVLLLVLALGLALRADSRRGQGGGTRDGDPSGPGAASAGRTAPSFSGVTLDGKAVSLEAYRGKPLILVFWASW